MQEKKSFLHRIAKPLLGVTVFLNLGFSIFLAANLSKKSKIGYVDMNKVIHALRLDVRTKNWEILKGGYAKISAKKEKQERLKRDFERRKSRGKSEDNLEVQEKIKKLGQEISREERAWGRDFYNRNLKSLVDRVSDVLEAVEYARKKNKCDVVNHQSILACIDSYPSVHNNFRKIVSCDDALDLSKDVLEKLGLKEEDSKEENSKGESSKKASN